MHSAYLLGLYEDGPLDATPASSDGGGSASSGRGAHATNGDRDAHSNAEMAGTYSDGDSAEEGAASAARTGAAAVAPGVPHGNPCGQPAVALGLRRQLRSLELSQVVFDSDYTIGLFACLPNLCSLKVRAGPWLKVLAPGHLL